MKQIQSTLIVLTMLAACSPSVKERTIPFGGIENARELGGLAMHDGRTILPGKLVRSGNLAKATDSDIALLKERFDLSDVFDFRFDAEASAEPDVAIDGVSNTRLSTLPQAFIDGFTAGRADTAKAESGSMIETLAGYAFNPGAQEMARQLYPAIVMDSTAQSRYGAFLHGVLEARGGVLWHCSQGKDRAGLGTAFVLAALGADRQTIVDDFSLSNVSYAKLVESLSESVRQKGGGEAELAFIQSMVGVSVENFEKTLDLIDRQYGSLPAYLEKALGFSAAEQERLKSKLLE